DRLPLRSIFGLLRLCCNFHPSYISSDNCLGELKFRVGCLLILRPRVLSSLSLGHTSASRISQAISESNKIPFNSTFVRASLSLMSIDLYGLSQTLSAIALALRTWNKPIQPA